MSNSKSYPEVTDETPVEAEFLTAPVVAENLDSSAPLPTPAPVAAPKRKKADGPLARFNIKVPIIVNGEHKQVELPLEKWEVKRAKTSRIVTLPTAPKSMADIDLLSFIVGENELVKAFAHVIKDAGIEASIELGDEPFTDTAYTEKLREAFSVARAKGNSRAALDERLAKLMAEATPLWDRISIALAGGTQASEDDIMGYGRIQLEIKDVMTALAALENKSKKK